MLPALKYPRTPHVTGSRLQPGDEDLPIVDLDQTIDWIVEEKLDGANSAIRFESESELILQSRGHVLSGGPRERQFDLFKRWTQHHRAALWTLLGTRYVLYGEWLYARHTIRYDSLTHYFYEFDMLDRKNGEFLNTSRRHRILSGAPVQSVPIVHRGKVQSLKSLLARSPFSTTDGMEGLYLKHEEDGRVVSRYKYVRRSFTQAVADSGEHWMDRPLEPNHLREGVDLFA